MRGVLREGCDGEGRTGKGKEGNDGWKECGGLEIEEKAKGLK